MLMAAEMKGRPDTNLIFSRSFMPAQRRDQFFCIILGEESLYRVRMVKHLKKFSSLKILAEAATLDDLQHKLGKTRPDLAFVHITIGGKNPLVIIRLLKETFPGITVIVTADYDKPDLIKRFFLTGANGYLLRSSIETQLAEAVQSINLGKVYIDRTLHNLLLEYIFQSADPDSQSVSGLGLLSDKEFEVFILMGRGLSRKKISDLTGFSISSIVGYLRQIRNCLGLSTNGCLKEFAIHWVRENLKNPSCRQ